MSDPPGWAFSSYRDALGLALPAVGRRVADPARLHAFVSGDPTVRPEGTALPERAADGRAIAPGALPAAVSALTRTPGALLRGRGPARDLLVRAARALTDASSAEIAALAGVGASTVRHHDGMIDAQVAQVARVAGDPRLAPLNDGDLRSLPAWREYKHLR